jgi:hypothetical protein
MHSPPRFLSAIVRVLISLIPIPHHEATSFQLMQDGEMMSFCPNHEFVESHLSGELGMPNSLSLKSKSAQSNELAFTTGL